MKYFENPNHAISNCKLTPLYPRTKQPFIKEWQLNGFAGKTISEFGPFPQRNNIGIMWGKDSNDYVDIDLDGPCTVQAGSLLLTETGLMFGRDSRPKSHWIYKVSGSTETLQIRHPDTNEMIVEVRGDRSQTMGPLSIHPITGEQIRFEDGKEGEPALVDRNALNEAVRQIATVSVLADCWVEGRHDLALWFAGLCACQGVPIEACFRVVEAICVIRGDEEPDDRIRAVQDTYADVADRKPVEWRSKLTGIVGERVIPAIIEWMGGRPLLPNTNPGSSSGRTVSVTIDTSTDISTAEGFKASMGDRLIYGEHSEQFFRLDNGVYDPITNHAVKGDIIDFLKEPFTSNLQVDPVKIRSSQSNARINAVLELTKTLSRRDDRQFDKQSYLLGTKNGVLDLSLMRLVDPTDIITRRIGAEYRLNADCPLFKKFIGEVFQNDADIIAYIQRVMGYTLTASVEAQAMFILIGSGANGKSVFLNLIQALMGDYGTSLPPHSIMQGKFGNDRTDDLASLDGKRFVFATEGEAGDKLASAKVKRMTGGDMMSVKPLYKDYFNMKPEFKMMFGSNELPRINGNDDAIWRRIHLIDFKRTFTPDEQDPKLLGKLKDELPGVLNWSLEGLRQIGEMKGDFLAPPDSVRKAISDYRNENDNVGDFIEAACVRDEKGRVMAGDLYANYVTYSNNSGVQPLNQITFSKSLNRLGIGVHKMSKGNARKGIILK